MKFKDKVVVVTGGAAGIGKCIVKEFKKAGAKVAVIDKTEADSEADFFYCGDIAEENALHDFAGQVKTDFGQIDYLINNACLSRGGILSDCSFEDFLYVQKVGVAAPYFLTKLFLPNFAPEGAIVNICSTRAFMSQAGTESYSAAKGGILSLTHALSASLSGYVRVNSVSPGWIDNTASDWSLADNAQHPAGRIGKPEDIANMVLYLCSPEASFISGQNITIDGGMSKLMIYHGDHGWTYTPKECVRDGDPQGGDSREVSVGF
ncbi:MAG: SDR family oxidoreductase [Fibrobacter sp.]|jgi:NAD(P)-dependent dehydrogenase (short-subunit alcohol dehydrogenase family)|nr:SDR family oxidoreductase [Fibrobacter sp.]